jgi:hypothetical protein
VGSVGRFPSGDAFFPIVPPWRRSTGADASPADRIREALIADSRRHSTGTRRWRDQAHFIWQYCLRSPARRVRKLGDKAKADGAPSKLRQFLHVSWVAWRWQVPSKDYYTSRLYRADHARHVSEIIPRRYLKPWMYTYLYSGLDLNRSAPLKNKRQFANVCVRDGLPHIPVLGVFDRRGARWTSKEEVTQDVFMKPSSWSGGRGAAAFRFDAAASGFVDRDGTVHSREEFEARYLELGRSTTYLVTPLVRNHPAIQPISSAALSTVRAITVLNEQGEPELCAAVLRMAVDPDSLVDNGHAGGIAAPIDLHTGELGLAASLHGWKLNDLTHHPASGAPIAGVTLPRWDDLRALVVRAQASFPGRRLVGWDIAITADGPVIVEGNVAPGLDLIQRTQGPLGRSRLGELLAWHVEDRARILDATATATATAAADAGSQAATEGAAAAA